MTDFIVLSNMYSYATGFNTEEALKLPPGVIRVMSCSGQAAQVEQPWPTGGAADAFH